MYNVGLDPLLKMRNSPTEDDTVVFMTRGLTASLEYARQLPSASALADIYALRDAPMLEYLMLNAMIYVYGHERRMATNVFMHTLANMKTQLHFFLKNGAKTGDYKAVAAGELNEYEKLVIDRISLMLDKYRQSLTEKGATESVITACAPIVPVVGAIRKPFAAEIEAEKAVSFTQDTAAVKHMAFDQLMKAFHIPDFIAQLLAHSTMFEHIDGVDQLIHIIRLNQETTGPLANIVAYYSWAWIYTNAAQLQNSDVTTLIETIQHIDTVPFENAINAFEKNLPASEAELVQHLEDIDRTNRFLKVPDAVKANISTFHAFDDYDINGLLNYIYTSRRYRANNYTNSAFVRSVDVSGYLFYKEYLLVQPKTEEPDVGNEYIYCPVMDDLQGSKPVIIRYWKNGNIDVLTERQFWDIMTPGESEDHAKASFPNRVSDEVAQ